MSNKKLSLSLLNSLLLIVFLVIVTLAILLSTYVNTQKVVGKNINDYFNQTFNLSSLILDNEKESLFSIANEIGHKLYNQNDITSISDLDSIDSSYLDEVDILFLKRENDTIDYSNSLYDTDEIIKNISKQNINSKDSIISVNIEDENFIIILSSKKIIDSNTGRVNAVFYVGKIFNDNFTLLNKIKRKAKLNDLYLFFDNNLIATTNTEKALDFSIFDESDLASFGNLLYSNKEIKMNIESKPLNLVFVSSNSTFDILQESYLKQSILLLVFVSFSFLFLYFLSNKYIINPFSKLLDYAHKIKDNKNVKYETTQVIEFDEFAYELKGIINEIKDLKEQYSRAIDGVQDGLWDIDIKNKDVFFSSRFMTMLGYSKDEKIKSHSFWQRSIHKDDYKKTIDSLRNHINSKSDLFESEYRFKCKDGTYKWIKVRGKIFLDENNQQSRMTGFHTDIDDLKKLQTENQQKEQMLYQQSKLASMGEMIGNIAHQWRQPLTVISVVASAINMQYELGTLDKETARNDFKKLMDTVQYLSSIIDKFRLYFSPDNKEEIFNVKKAIEGNLEIFESSYKSNNINLVLDLEDIEIKGYQFELMQVIINIINNAKDALIENMANKTQERLIFMKSHSNHDRLTIKIYDNAGGIPEDISHKIFEPYFTTKHQSQGTGLGLYMSSQIIQSHFNGTLSNKTIEYDYEDKKYKGEEFIIDIQV